jgi:hypothetical protein
VPLDAELVVPAPVEARPVRLYWTGPQGRLDQRAGARLDAALLYARLAEGHPAAMTVVYRFLDAWQEYLRHALPLLAGALLPLSDTASETDTGDISAADRAIARLRAALTATAVDVAAVHREMLAVDEFFGGLEARAEAALDAGRDGDRTIG